MATTGVVEWETESEDFAERIAIRCADHEPSKKQDD